MFGKKNAILADFTLKFAKKWPFLAFCMEISLHACIFEKFSSTQSYLFSQKWNLLELHFACRTFAEIFPLDRYSRVFTPIGVYLTLYLTQSIVECASL